MTECSKPTLLVLRHHGLGDLVTVQPALHGLRRAFPGHHLVTTCPSWLVPLAEFFGTADQLVSEKSEVRPNSGKDADPTCHQLVDAALLSNVFDEVQSVDVLISLRTPGIELLTIVQTFAPRLFVSYRFDALAATEGFPELDFSDHILMRWQRLLRTIGIELHTEDMYAQLPLRGSDKGNTIVHIGAGSPSRLWPLERWAKVTEHLHAMGHRIILTGSGAEATMVAEVRRQACLPAECDRSGTDIRTLAQLVAGARLVVSVDSGVSHLATAFRRPAVTLFGPVPPAWWGPPPGNPQHKTLWTLRIGDNYSAVVDPGLMEIRVKDVLGAIDDLQKSGM